MFNAWDKYVANVGRYFLILGGLCSFFWSFLGSGDLLVWFDWTIFGAPLDLLFHLEFLKMLRELKGIFRIVNHLCSVLFGLTHLVDCLKLISNFWKRTIFLDRNRPIYGSLGRREPHFLYRLLNIGIWVIAPLIWARWIFFPIFLALIVSWL